MTYLSSFRTFVSWV